MGKFIVLVTYVVLVTIVDVVFTKPQDFPIPKDFPQMPAVIPEPLLSRHLSKLVRRFAREAHPQGHHHTANCMGYRPWYMPAPDTAAPPPEAEDPAAK